MPAGTQMGGEDQGTEINWAGDDGVPGPGCGGGEEGRSDLTGLGNLQADTLRRRFGT